MEGRVSDLNTTDKNFTLSYRTKNVPYEQKTIAASYADVPATPIKGSLQNGARVEVKLLGYDGSSCYLAYSIEVYMPDCDGDKDGDRDRDTEHPAARGRATPPGTLPERLFLLVLSFVKGRSDNKGDGLCGRFDDVASMTASAAHSEV